APDKVQLSSVPRRGDVRQRAAYPRPGLPPVHGALRERRPPHRSGCIQYHDPQTSTQRRDPRVDACGRSPIEPARPTVTRHPGDPTRIRVVSGHNVNRMVAPARHRWLALYHSSAELVGLESRPWDITPAPQRIEAVLAHNVDGSISASRHHRVGG